METSFIDGIKSLVNLPVGIGFGISEPDVAKKNCRENFQKRLGNYFMKHVRHSVRLGKEKGNRHFYPTEEKNVIEMTKSGWLECRQGAKKKSNFSGVEVL